jgi:methyltransferase-like protein 6
LLEIGCGVGNFVFPLIKEDSGADFFIYACDFSGRAVEIVKSHPLYDESKVSFDQNMFAVFLNFIGFL